MLHALVPSLTRRMLAILDHVVSQAARGRVLRTVLLFTRRRSFQRDLGIFRRSFEISPNREVLKYLTGSNMKIKIITDNRNE